MSSVIERAREHYRERLTETRVIKVPEWGEGDEPQLIYVRPANLATRDRMYKYAKDGSLRAVAEALIARARDESGAMLFAPRDAEALMKEVDPDVMARVVDEMNEDIEELDDAGIAAAAKN